MYFSNFFPIFQLNNNFIFIVFNIDFRVYSYIFGKSFRNNEAGWL